MNDAQKKAFEDAKKKASDLMGSLYRLRSTFLDNESKVTEEGRDVWQHIPRAQTLVHKIQDEIDAAEKSVLEAR